MNELLRNFSNDTMDITTEEGRKFAEEILEFIRLRMQEYQEETGNLYNLEATPAEGTTHRFAREDQKRYPDIIQAGPVGQRYYTNSSQLPVGHTSDLFRALQLQDELQCCYTGGTVFHMYMNEAISSPEACRDIVRKVLTRFRMPYLTVTPLFPSARNTAICAGSTSTVPSATRSCSAFTDTNNRLFNRPPHFNPTIKTTMTKQEILSKYAQDRTRCTVYTRVMGYHRPVETFNAGKQGEFHDRVHFVEPDAPCNCSPRTEQPR